MRRKSSWRSSASASPTAARRWRSCRRRSSVSPPLDRNAAVDHEERLFQVSDLKAFLQGEWSLERRVQDRRAAQDGRLSGAAAFTADGSGLLCRERSEEHTSELNSSH